MSVPTTEMAATEHPLLAKRMGNSCRALGAWACIWCAWISIETFSRVDIGNHNMKLPFNSYMNDNTDLIHRNVQATKLSTFQLGNTRRKVPMFIERFINFEIYSETTTNFHRSVGWQR